MSIAGFERIDRTGGGFMKRIERTHRTGSNDRLPSRRGRRLLTFVPLFLIGLSSAIVPTSARAQPPKPFIPEISERSGLLMRFASTPELLPPDPNRDFFYKTRYADSGRVKHPNWVCTQGLYGLGMKTPDTQSVYPYFYGVPGQNTIDSSSRPWFRPARFFQGLIHPFRPVGSYYAMGSYVPIYDLDPIAPGPGPYPYPIYFNWLHGG
jgi:hypothetical protein